MIQKGDRDGWVGGGGGGGGIPKNIEQHKY